MIDTPSDQRQATGEWLVSTLRLTVFPAEPITPPRDGWWAAVIGEEPETITYKKSLDLQEVGKYTNKTILLSANPLRIDWRLLPIDVEDIENFPNTCSLSDGFELFLPLMHRWLSEYSPNLQRLGLGVDIFLLAENKEDSFVKLAPYIPVRIDPPNTSDFIYQINRVRDSVSGIGGLRINRLSKWGALKFEFGVPVEGGDFPLPGLERFSTRVELDINTTSDFSGILNRDESHSVLDELVGLAREIIEKGDIL